MKTAREWAEHALMLRTTRANFPITPAMEREFLLNAIQAAIQMAVTDERDACLIDLVNTCKRDFPAGGTVENAVAMVLKRAMERIQSRAEKTTTHEPPKKGDKCLACGGHGWTGAPRAGGQYKCGFCNGTGHLLPRGDT